MGQGYVFTRVCDSVHREGLPHCMLGYTPSPGSEVGTGSSPWTRQTPPPGPGNHPPPGSRTPPRQCMLGDTGNNRAGRILLECNLLSVSYLLHPLQIRWWMSTVPLNLASADSKGALFGKKWQILDWRPQLWGWRPFREIMDPPLTRVHIPSVNRSVHVFTCRACCTCSSFHLSKSSVAFRRSDSFTSSILARSRSSSYTKVKNKIYFGQNKICTTMHNGSADNITSFNRPALLVSLACSLAEWTLKWKQQQQHKIRLWFMWAWNLYITTESIEKVHMVKWKVCSHVAKFSPQIFLLILFCIREFNLGANNIDENIRNTFRFKFRYVWTDLKTL